MSAVHVVSSKFEISAFGIATDMTRKFHFGMGLNLEPWLWSAQFWFPSGYPVLAVVDGNGSGRSSRRHNPHGGRSEQDETQIPTHICTLLMLEAFHMPLGRKSAAGKMH
jgi:hypothetical protein